MEALIGIVAMITGTIVIFLGLPSQIVKNQRAKSANGLSLCMWGLLPLNSVVWMLYGAFQDQPDWVIILPNIFAFVFQTTILVQIFYYRKLDPIRSPIEP